MAREQAGEEGVAEAPSRVRGCVRKRPLPDRRRLLRLGSSPCVPGPLAPQGPPHGFCQPWSPRARCHELQG